MRIAGWIQFNHSVSHISISFLSSAIYYLLLGTKALLSKFILSSFMLQVFVYGTLKPNEKYYRLYCQGKTVAEVRCWTRGKLFALPVGYPAMIPGNEKVYGYLLSFTSENELANLDQLEGYSGEVNSPVNEYDRLKITVYDDNNRSLDQAWAYFMTETKVQQLNGIYLPSGWWSVNIAIRNDL